ncbi:14482_t:CDS:2, partial [Gigaspora margarita]
LRKETKGMPPATVKKKDSYEEFESGKDSYEGFESEEETTKEYYKWIEELNQKFECVLICMELPKYGELTVGIEFSDENSNWKKDNNDYIQ